MRFACRQTLEIRKDSLFRDVFFYSLAIGVVVFVIAEGKATIYDSSLLLLLYVVFLTILFIRSRQYRRRILNPQ